VRTGRSRTTTKFGVRNKIISETAESADEHDVNPADSTDDVDATTVPIDDDVRTTNDDVDIDDNGRADTVTLRAEQRADPSLQNWFRLATEKKGEPRQEESSIFR